MIAIEVQTPAWLAGAVCASTDPELFHPESGSSPAAAKAICATCPVRRACLAWAVAEEIPHGIYGGRTARERRETARDAAA